MHIEIELVNTWHSNTPNNPIESVNKNVLQDKTQTKSKGYVSDYIYNPKDLEVSTCEDTHNLDYKNHLDYNTNFIDKDPDYTLDFDSKKDYIVADVNQQLSISQPDIKTITTNNSNCIKITSKIEKSFIKRKVIYTITFLKSGHGNIRVTYKHGPEKIQGIYILGKSNTDVIPLPDVTQLGSLAGDIPEYWLNGDSFIKSKYIDVLYCKVVSFDIDYVSKFISLCNKVGCEGILVIKIKDFTGYESFIEVVSRINHPGLNLKIINCATDEPEKMNWIAEVTLQAKLQFSHCINSCSFIELINKTENFNDTITVIKTKCNEIIAKYSSIRQGEYITFATCKNQEASHVYGGSSEDKLWSNDQWLTLLFIVKTICNGLKLPSILIDIPVGHVNGIQSTSLYTNKLFINHTNKLNDYQNTASLFFFGGCVQFSDTKFHENKWEDTGLIIDKSTVCSKEHISLCNNYNIKYILFGPENIYSTTNVPLKHTGNKPTDHNYTICQFKKFYER